MDGTRSDVAGVGSSAGFDRRQFMRRAGMAGVAVGTVAWSAPQILSASPAAAAVGSAPPQLQGPQNRLSNPSPPPPIKTEVLAETVAKPTATPATPAPATNVQAATLAQTGTNSKLLVEWGGGLLATGSALVIATQTRQAKSQPVENRIPEPPDARD